jgi:hypothetical protein
MNPLPDRTVILGLLATLGLVFALVFWFVRLAPSQEPPLLWREPTPQSQPAPNRSVLPGSARGELI